MSVLAPTDPVDDDAADPWAAPPARFTGFASGVGASDTSLRHRLQDLLDDPRNRIILTMAAVAVVGLVIAAALDALRSGTQPEELTTIPSAVVDGSAPGGDAGAVGFGAANVDEAIDSDGATPTETSAPVAITAAAATAPTASSTTSTSSAPSTTATPTSAPIETEPPVTEPPPSTVDPTPPTSEAPTSAPPTSEAPTTTPDPTTPTSVSTTASTAPAPTPAAPPGGGSTQQQILDLVNVERAAAQCGPLTLDARLSTAAQSHSNDMAAQNYFSHTGLDGSTPSSRARAAGYSGSSIGENIAQGYRSPEAVMTGWMNSSGHRANILNCGYRHLGIGHNASGDYWTQLFGS